jgi:hypothetical protein
MTRHSPILNLGGSFRDHDFGCDMGLGLASCPRSRNSQGTA